MLQPGSSDEPRESRLRVAFFGGSFDPPHLGHLAVARAARDGFRLDTVLFAPVGAQPLKPEGCSARFDQRVAMTRLAIEGERGFAVSLADAPKASAAPNYTLETLKELRGQTGANSELFCLMGADSFFALRKWHRAEEIPFAAELIVASRPGEALSELRSALPDGLTFEGTPGVEAYESGVEVRCLSILNRAGNRTPFYVMPGLDVEISASEIRDEIRRGIHVPAGQDAGKALLPSAVAEYVQAHGLYR